MLDWIHATLRWSHIILGCVGLALFWGAALTPKGGILHRRLGVLFVQATYLIVGTALVSCAWNLIHPESFSGDNPLTEDKRLALRITAMLLTALAMMTWSAAVLGVRSLRTKSDPQRLLSRQLQIIFVVQGLAGVALLATAVMDGMATDWQPRYWFCIVLGVLTTLNAVGEHQYARNPPDVPRAWLAKHIGCMIGCGIAFHTALSLTGARYLLQGLLPGPLSMLPWILPSAIGLPLAAYLVRRYVPDTPAPVVSKQVAE